MSYPKGIVTRPLKFKTVEALEKVIDEYFDWCDNRAVKIWDEKKQKEFMIGRPAPYTMAGLARRLGVDRKTLVNYSHREKYFPAIRDAREKVHEDVETRMMDTRNEKGAIFNLKNNFGWRDESQEELTIKGKTVSLLPVHVPRNDSAQQGPQPDTED